MNIIGAMRDCIELAGRRLRQDEGSSMAVGALTDALWPRTGSWQRTTSATSRITNRLTTSATTGAASPRITLRLFPIWKISVAGPNACERSALRIVVGPQIKTRRPICPYKCSPTRPTTSLSSRPSRRLWWGRRPRLRRKTMTLTHYQRQEMRTKQLNAEFADLQEANAKLRHAATMLYQAGYWTCDADCAQDELWQNLKDALGFEPGKTPPEFQTERT